MKVRLKDLRLQLPLLLESVTLDEDSIYNKEIFSLLLYELVDASVVNEIVIVRPEENVINMDEYRK
jgi:hypothetical protein